MLEGHIVKVHPLNASTVVGLDLKEDANGILVRIDKYGEREKRCFFPWHTIARIDDEGRQP